MVSLSHMWRAQRRVLGLLLAVLQVPWSAHGQSIARAHPNWDVFTSMGRVASLVATPTGIWCATGGGVLTYSPETRSYARLTHLDGLAGNRVLSLTRAADGDLWFGTDGAGLSRYVSSGSYLDAPVDVFAGLRVTGMVSRGDLLYVATESGVSVFGVGSRRVRQTYRQFGPYSRGAEVVALAIHRDHLWVSTPEGVARASLTGANLQDPDAWTAAGPVGQVVGLVVVDGDLYSGGPKGVYRWDPEAGRWSPAGLGSAVRAIGSRGPRLAVIDSHGDLRIQQTSGRWQRTELPGVGDPICLSTGSDTLWIGTSRGLTAVGAPSPPQISDPPSNHFFDLATGPQGDLWAASVPDDRTTQARGVYHLADSRWRVYDSSTGLPSSNAVAVGVDGDGRIWVGTWGHGVALRSPEGVWTHRNQINSVLEGITTPRDPGFVVVASVARGRPGQMWLSNLQAGLAVIQVGNPRTGHLYSLEDLGLPSGTETGPVTVGDDGLVFAGTPERGLVVLDDGATPFTPGDDWSLNVTTASESRLSSDRVTAVLAHGGLLWLGTDNGLHRLQYTYSRQRQLFEITNWRSYRQQTGLPSTDITDLTLDDRGHVWVATRGGVAQVRTSGLLVHAFTRDNSGLVANRVESVHYDGGRGVLWIGTYEGLSRLQLAAPAGEGAADLLVYPNPFVASLNDIMTFAGLPLGTGLSIHAADGSVVRSLEPQSGGAVLTWDGTNRSAKPVASGVYYYATVGNGPVRRGRIAVVTGD